MTTNHHTPPVDGAPANMSVIRAPLSELDSAITDHETRIGTLEGDMPVPSGSPTEYYDGDGNWTVPAGTGASVDGHVIKNEGVSLPQRASVDFVGAGVTVTNEAGGTQVSVPGGGASSSVEFTASNKLLGRITPGAGAGEELPITAVGRSKNLLINGGFDFAQRQVPATLTTIAQDRYSADRWRISRENADLQYQRVDGLGESGLTSKYFGTFKKITNTGKLMVYQIIEGAESVCLRGKTIIFQAKMKASSAKTIRMAVLELQNAGTIDTIPATFVSAWGANSTDPTLGSQLAVITAAQSKSVTTSMQEFNISVTVPSNSKNLICAIWSDSQFAANDTLSIAEVGLYASSTVQEWVPNFTQQEFALCERYYEKNRSPDVITGVAAFRPAFISVNTSFALGVIIFSSAKRVSPTMTFISNAGTPAACNEFNGGSEVTGIGSTYFDTKGCFGISSSGGFTAGLGYTIHYTAEAEL